MNYWGGHAFGNSWFSANSANRQHWDGQAETSRAGDPNRFVNFYQMRPRSLLQVAPRSTMQVPPRPFMQVPSRHQMLMQPAPLMQIPTATTNMPSGPKISQNRKRGRMQWTGDSSQPNVKRKKKDARIETKQGLALEPSDLSYEHQLSLTIWKNYVDFRQPNELYATKMELRRRLCDILEPFGRECVFVVGSSINGFGSKKSDLDLCLHITCNQSLLNNRISSAILIGIKKALFASRQFSDVQYIPARVPILKFVDSVSRIEIDLNLNNTPGLFNTRLLALYCALDWRVRPLGMYFKHWARECDIHDASRGRLSSYALNLMLIHFLQSGCTPPVLPCLQKDFPNLFEHSGQGMHVIDMSLSCVPEVLSVWRSHCPENRESLGQLFSGLIGYYNNVDFEDTAFSVRLGRQIPLRIAVNQQPAEELRRMQAGRSNSKIFMEEPFTLSNASRSPFDESVFAVVKRAFAKTNRFLRLRKNLSEVAPV